MSNVHQMRWKLLREQLTQVYRRAQRQEDETLSEGLIPDKNAEILLRLAGAALTLLDWHAIDAKGRCQTRACAGRRRLPWRRGTCQVFGTIQFWIRQPLTIVQKTARQR